MYLPLYGGFSFAVAKTPNRGNQWHSCKEYAGRALGRRNPKHYVTITVWSGHRMEGDQHPKIGHQAKALQDHLNDRCKEWKCHQKFVVKSVPNHAGLLHVRVPFSWCDNRITAHLLFTYIRQFLIGDSRDATHMNIADQLLLYGKKVGLYQFNQEMRALNPYNKLMGICNAVQKWKQNAAN